MKTIEDITLKKTNLEINYEDWIDENNHSTIVILHWWWGSSQSWLVIGELLFKAWFNVIIPDLPWFWKTKLNKIFDLDEYAKVVEEFIKELWLENIILWWHSNWWSISIKIVDRKKVSVSKLVLNNSAWIRNNKKRNIKRKVFKFIVKYFKFLKKIFIFKKIRILFYKVIWWRDYLNAEKSPHLKWTFLNIIKSDLSTIIPKIDIDTLLIRWRNDTYTPVSDWMFMRKSIKKSKMVILEDEKHGIHIKSPEKLVNTFLQNI